MVDGEKLGSLIEHQIPLSKFLNPFDLISLQHVEAMAGNVARAPSAFGSVPIDHNSSEYKAADAALDKLLETARGANDLESADEKEKAQAEISALKRLLQASKAGIGVVSALVVSGVGYLMIKFADKAVGEAATAAWHAMEKLLGFSPNIPF